MFSRKERNRPERRSEVFMIKKLLSCVGAYKKYAILAPIFVALEVFLEILIPLTMSDIIDIGINGPMEDSARLAYVTKMGIIMVAMALLSLLCGALSGKFASVAAVGFAKNVRKRMFDKIQDFSFSNIDKFSTASLVTRLTTDVTNTQNAFMMCDRILVRAPVMLITATAIAFFINAKLALVFIVAIPVLAIAFIVISTKAFPRFQKFLKQFDKLNARIQEMLINIRVIKAFVREDYENEKFNEVADNLRESQFRAEKIIICSMPLMQLVTYGCMLSIYWFGGNFIVNGEMLSGDLVSFITYIMMILMSLMMVCMIFISLVLSRASFTRVVEVFDEEIDITEKADGLTEVKDGSISFRNVNFSYSGDLENPNLENINLEIKSGETIGIIGGTGSAKSTLVQLIPRLYDVTEGEILVGGKNVKDYTLDALRNEVAMVLQKNVLFSGTIRENLLWGDINATQEEIEEACRAAQAHDFIASFPDGYETDLGQGGVNVSGGQKQRLCIARALLKKPKIVILDDSTSAVDTATDSKIRAAFREKLSDTTTIIIAQRISSVCDADRIIVLDDGKINAVGTHDELVETNEIYREVFESQQKGAE